MTPEQLKASILQYAIQGKLVEQRPEEGTGEELYRQIQAEKQRLIKEGKIKKEKALPEIAEDEIPFDIPDSWKWCRITDCGVFISGYTPKPVELTSEGVVPYFKVSDMNTTGNELFLINTESYLKSSNPKCFLKNTIVYPKNGGAVFTNKKRILSQNSVVDLNTGGYYPIEPLDLMFVYIFFSNIDFRKCYKGTALPTIDMDRLKSKWFPLPPLAEQKRIVAKIEELLPYVDRYAAAYEKLEQFNAKFPEDMKKSILQYAIQGKLVEQRPEEGTGEELYRQIQSEKQRMIKEGKIKKEKPLPEIAENEIPFDIPDSWKWVRIGQIFNLQAGKNITASDIYEEVSCEHRYLCYGGNGVRGYVSNFNREGHYALIGRQGALCGNINVAEGQFYATEHAVVVDHFNQTDVVWSAWFLKALNLNQYATATAQPGLAVANIVKVLIPLPPLAEQIRIVAKLEEILPLCERLK